MTVHERITTPADIDRELSMTAIRALLRDAVTIAEGHPDGQRVLGEVLCAALDTVAAGAPRYEMWGDMRREAEWWADCATPAELETYAAAALRRITRTAFAERARKRLLWTLWQSMPDEAKAAFLSRVEREREPP